ncbi:glycosyl hydrolase family 28-related protein [Paenibacillus chitinolyticus]|uniref:glycosyl hydrolase family 28-related protein n=1 Tax=Paenibacillus chitinolyticus TaxID=79263 RepID=UPI0036DD92F9
MAQVSELKAQQFVNATLNMRSWGDLIFNVKAFGAVGNGIADDTQAVNAAAMAAMANGGGVVKLPPGIYNVSGSITAITKGGVYFEGSGPYATIIRHKSDTGNLFQFGDVSLGGIGVIRGGGVSNLSIHHNTTRSSGVTVLMQNAQNIKVKDVQFQNAITFAQCGGGTDDSSLFTVLEDVIGSLTGNGVGVDIRGGSHGIHLLNLQFNNEYNGTAIRINTTAKGMDTLYMDNCLFQRFMFGMLCNSALGTVQNAFLTNVVFDGMDVYSLLFQPSASAIYTRFNFVGCWFTSRTNAAVVIDGPSTTIVDGIYFADSRWVTVYKQGVFVVSQYVKNIDIDNCILSNCSTEGSGLHPAIQIVDNTKKFNITNSKIGEEGATLALQSYAIRIGANCDLYTIANNDLIGNVTGAIWDGAGTYTAKLIKDNLGYNPVGNLAPPALPTSGTALKNPFSSPVQVFIYAGTVTSIAKNGSSIPGMANGQMILYPGESITVSYTAAPTWSWFGL